MNESRAKTMRWIWIDKFVEFESGRRAVAVKNVSLAEEHLHDHYPGYPVMPLSLVIEGVAQTGGILVGEAREYREKVVLAKVKRARFDGMVLPGSQLRYEVSLDSISDEAALISSQITCDGEAFGEVDLMFSHVDKNMSGLNFPEENFVFTEEFIGLLGTYRLKRESALPAE